MKEKIVGFVKGNKIKVVLIGIAVVGLGALAAALAHKNDDEEELNDGGFEEIDYDESVCD